MSSSLKTNSGKARHIHRSTEGLWRKGLKKKKSFDTEGYMNKICKCKLKKNKKPKPKTQQQKNVPSVLHSSSFQKKQSFNILYRDSGTSLFWNSLIPHNAANTLVSGIAAATTARIIFCLLSILEMYCFFWYILGQILIFFNAKTQPVFLKPIHISKSNRAEYNFHSPRGWHSPKIFGLAWLQCKKDWIRGSRDQHPLLTFIQLPSRPVFA